MKSLLVCAAMAVLLLSSPIGVSEASAGEPTSMDKNQNLTDRQIAQRFEEINSKYQVGEEFSEDDAEFVRTYATPAGSGDAAVMATQSQSFSKTGSRYGVSASFSGSVFSNIGLLTSSFGGNVRCTILSGQALQWLSTELHITQTTYGLVGSSGIGIIYSGHISAGPTHASPFSMNQSRTYNGLLAVFGYTHSYCVIHTKTGTFSITGI